ncbi:uncharacterized protein LOC110441410 [Mizuhopecten yessoensis]|uniref:uncharacterized protein LOC110441410 n=1 Tax=Mizuhopecten yessoensis TaxID=6573 RepID=UPI000B45ED1C|nr:uncharacterized protein LOC110441410 [Mizuhopecten yessoensis]
MAYIYIFFLILFAVFEESFSELCISGYYSNYRYYTYCSSGCCGSYYNEYCCSSLEVGTIAGIVIGCIFALVILVVVIICVCAQCKKKKTGVVISNNQPHTAVAFEPDYDQRSGSRGEDIIRLMQKKREDRQRTGQPQEGPKNTTRQTVPTKIGDRTP